MTTTGIDPEAIGTEVRLGRRGRENKSTKARRLLLEGRVSIRRVDQHGVLADVKGDSGFSRRVVFDAYGGDFSCSCEARGRCSHIEAVQLVVILPAGAGD